MRLDRRLYSAVTFPADYGFVAGTEGADGEPLDALVLLEDPAFPGCWVRARVVGVFWIRHDKQGQNHREAKIITVADGDPNFQEVEDLDQLPEHLLAELENFFDVYKMLEPGTSPAPDGYEGREAALREVEAARNRPVIPRRSDPRQRSAGELRPAEPIPPTQAVDRRPGDAAVREPDWCPASAPTAGHHRFGRGRRRARRLRRSRSR